MIPPNDDDPMRDVRMQGKKGRGYEHDDSPASAIRHESAPCAPKGGQVERLAQVLGSGARLLQHHVVRTPSKRVLECLPQTRVAEKAVDVNILAISAPVSGAEIALRVLGRCPSSRSCGESAPGRKG